MRTSRHQGASNVLTVVGIALLLWAVGTVPYLYAWLSAPADRFYTGLMFDVADHAQYWSWVTASRDGLFISNTMTPEPNAPRFVNPMMWTLARVQGATGWGFGALMQFWRLLAAVAVAWATCYALATWVSGQRQRVTAGLLILLGGGAGWIWVVVKHLYGLPGVPYPLDVYVVEANTFFCVLAYPYLALAQALLVGTLAAVWRAHERRSFRAAAAAAVLAGLLGLTHAYDLLTVYALVGLAGLVTWLRARAFPWWLASTGVLVALASGPIALFYQRLTSNDPLWQQILGQYANAGVWTPSLPHLALLLGPVLWVAVPAGVTAVGRSDARRYLLGWALVGVCLSYAPVVYQIKFLTGLQVPLAILAAAVWHERLGPWLAERWARRAVAGSSAAASPPASAALARPALVPWALTALLVAAVVPTNVYLYAWRFVELSRGEPPYYLHVDEKAALDWMARNSVPGDVAVAPLEVGQFVPNYGRTRAMLAHWAMTARFFERREAVERIFDVATDRDSRERLLTRDTVTLVLRPSWGRWAGSWDPALDAGYDRVFHAGGASVFRRVQTAPATRPEAIVPGEGPKP